MNKKNEVGKGLRSLLSNIEKTNNPLERGILVKELSNRIAMISPKDIEVNPFQPRTEFDTDQLNDLATSIRNSGLIQPITVRSVGGNKYQLISGERRLRASKLAGLTEIPAYVRVANDEQMLEMALVENIQRADLNAIEIAISYQRLMEECNLTHETLSERVGKNRSTVTNYVRLLKLPPMIQNSVKISELSMGHARALAGVEDLSLQLKVYKQVLEQTLSVRALEKLIQSYQEPNTKETPKPLDGITPEIQKLETEISAILGVKIDIKRNTKGAGSLVLSFNNDNEFNQILEALRN